MKLTDILLFLYLSFIQYFAPFMYSQEKQQQSFKPIRQSP